MTPGVKGARYPGVREYIGYTQKPPKEREKEHMSDWLKKVKGAKWLYLATTEEPVVTEDRSPDPFVSAQLCAAR